MKKLFRFHLYCNMFLILVPSYSVNLTDINAPCFTSKLNKVFKYTTLLHLELRADDDVDNVYVDYLLKKSNIPLTITVYKSDMKTNEISKYPGERSCFVIVTGMKLLPRLMKLYISPSGMLFFILTDSVDIIFLEIILRSIWINKGSPHVYFLTQGGILAFHPFIYDFASKTYGKIIKYDDLGHADSLFDDMNGYPLIVDMFKSVYSVPVYKNSSKEIMYFTGTDSKVAQLLQRQMNFTFVRQTSDKYMFGYKLPNGTFTGAIGQILERKTDAVLTGFFIKDYGTYEIEYTVAVYTDKLCCYVPKAKRVPQSVLPLFSLDFKMWLSYIFTAFTCGGIWCIIRCFNLWLENHRRSYTSWHKKQFIQIFIDTWIIWVRVTLRNFPHFSSERLFVLYICMLSVIFGAIFDSSLATVYIKPLFYKDINTLAELDKSNLKIYYKYTSMKDDLFANATSALFTSLNTKLHFLESTKLPLIELMAQQGNFAGVTRDSVLGLENNVKYFTSKRIYKIPECPKTYSLAYLLPKHSVYSRKINILLLRFLGAGLINKWIDEMYFAAQLTEDHAEEVTVSFKILTLTDLQLAFYVLLLGSTLAAMLLALEIYKKRRRTKIHNNRKSNE